MKRFFCCSFHFPKLHKQSYSAKLLFLTPPSGETLWPSLGICLMASTLEIGRVAQSHLNGMSCQFKLTESKGPERKAEVGYQIQGEKIRIKTKPQPNKGCELDWALNKNNGRTMEEAEDGKLVMSYIRHFALFKSISPMESDFVHKMSVVISTYFIKLLWKSHEITRSEHYLYTVSTRANTSHHHYFYVQPFFPALGGWRLGVAWGSRACSRSDLMNMYIVIVCLFICLPNETVISLEAETVS